MSTTSPYREVGLSASVRPKKRKVKASKGWDAGGPKRGHSWDMMTASTCRLCGKPRFVVEDKPCPKRR